MGTQIKTWRVGDKPTDAEGGRRDGMEALQDTRRRTEDGKTEGECTVGSERERGERKDIDTYTADGRVGAGSPVAARGDRTGS